MNILTLHTNTQTADAQVVYDRFMNWIRTTNTDLYTMSPAEINEAIHIANGGPVRSPQHFEGGKRILNPIAWDQAYHMVMQHLDDQDNEILPPGDLVPRKESQEDRQNDEILPPTGVGRKKHKEDE